MATAVESVDSGLVEMLVADLAEFVMGDIVEQLPSVDRFENVVHETGISSAHLIVVNRETMVIPGFDMKYEKQPVGPNGEMRGGLLTGPATRMSKRGTRYNVIPINPDIEPGPYHKQNELDPELYASANMLASKAGEAAAMKFLMGAGATPDQVYDWQTRRYAGVREAMGGGQVVFRTVSSDSPQASWWYPPRVVEGTGGLEKAFAEIEALLGGGG